jgi:hypothetical protein
MSAFNEIDVACENCGEEFKATVWTAVHAGEDSVLKDILFGGELNLLMCPKCSHVAYYDHFVLYQDLQAELVAYIYPAVQQVDEEFLRQSTLKSFREAQELASPKDRKDYDPLLVFGLETFIEMMREEESRAEESQVAEAICQEHHLPYYKLRPSEARSLKTMRVIPGVQKNSATVIKGIEELLKINPRLESYAALAKELAALPIRLAP